MPDADSVLALLHILEVVRPAFAQRRTFGKFVAVAMGWVLAPRRHRITQSLLATGLAGKQHHDRFYRGPDPGTGGHPREIRSEVGD